MIGRITICEDCKYKSFTWNKVNCSKCGGRLEIIASTNKEEIVKQKQETKE